MTAKDDLGVTRRNVLRKSAVLSGGLVIGGIAASGNAGAHGRNVGYIRSVPGGTSVSEGAVLAVGDFVQTRNIRCEAGGQGQEKPPHTVDEYKATDQNGDDWRLYIQNPGGKKGTNPPAEVEILKVVVDCHANKLQKIQWSHA